MKHPAEVPSEVVNASREGEERFCTFVDHATDTLMLQDEDGTVLDANRNCCENLGYSRDELIGKTPFFFDLDLNAATWHRNRENLKVGDTATLESRYRRKDGTVFAVEVRMRKFHQGHRRLIVSLSRDITERARAAETILQTQVELTQASRVAAMGLITASVAHEVVPPITAILLNADAAVSWLNSQPPNVAEAQQALASLIADADRAGEAINWIRCLEKEGANRGPPALGPVPDNPGRQRLKWNGCSNAPWQH